MKYGRNIEYLFNYSFDYRIAELLDGNFAKSTKYIDFIVFWKYFIFQVVSILLNLLHLNRILKND